MTEHPEDQSAPPEADPTAVEPAEEDLPDKPAVEVPSDDEDPDLPTDEEEAEAGADWEDNQMPDEEAQDNVTVDDAEPMEPRHDDLPEGATREEYAEQEGDEG